MRNTASKIRLFLALALLAMGVHMGYNVYQFAQHVQAHQAVELR